MYYNIAKTHAFPVVFRVCSVPSYCKQFNNRPHGFINLVRRAKDFNGEMSNCMARCGSISSGFKLRRTVRDMSFSSSCSERVGEGSSAVARDGNSLPWLSFGKGKALKGVRAHDGSSSRKKRGKTLEKAVSGTSWEESAKRLEKGSESAENLGKDDAVNSARSSWENSMKPAFGSNRNGNRYRVEGKVKDVKYDYDYNEGNARSGMEEGEDELDVDEDPRWDKIKSKFNGKTNVKCRTEKPEFNRWNRQEHWGRKTWREATESTLPKMVGEGVYGVGPVLAALSANRRELYALYVQEGLDLTSNNKKKDKKGFEKVLRMAQKIGLSIREVSKHDLNMIVDNRPHQGLVLDVSPLEMVKVMELDTVSLEDDKGSLWVALDEVTDPQNLGAIIRSAYFFGASGIVLCAKNSAPLSGVVSKASAGSLEIMELRYCKNMMQFLVSSAENGWRVIGGSVASNAVPLNEVVAGEPTILVLGSEGTGLRPLVERSCTQLVRIPGNIPADVTTGGNGDIEPEESNVEHSSEEFRSFLAVESLNVSVAAGVLLHHLIGNNYKDK